MSRRDFGTIVERGNRQFYVRFWAGRGPAIRRYERKAGRTREAAKAKLEEVGAQIEIQDVTGAAVPSLFCRRSDGTM